MTFNASISIREVMIYSMFISEVSEMRTSIVWAILSSLTDKTQWCLYLKSMLTLCKDLLGNENNSFLRFFFFGGFFTHFTTIVLKTTTLNNVEKMNNQGSSESANLGFAVYKRSYLLHYNAIILYSMTSTLMKFFLCITLIV